MTKETRISGRGLGHRLKNVTAAHRAAHDAHAQQITDEMARQLAARQPVEVPADVTESDGDGTTSEVAGIEPVPPLPQAD